MSVKVKVGGDLSKIDIFPDDIFLASYPRSGSSWLRILLSSYVTGSENSVELVEKSCQVVAEIYESSVEALARMKRPRIIKTHSPFDAALPRVIYLVRDARDVAVSYYHFHLKFSKAEIPFEKYIDSFNLGEVDGFGPWNDHVNSWLDGREASEDFLVVRYEDLKVDACEQLKRVVNFIWGEADADKLTRAVEAAELSKLQEGEKRSNWFPGSNSNVAFFRSGTVGDWKNYFSQDMLRDFLLMHKSGLRRLGYLSLDELGQITDSLVHIAKSATARALAAETSEQETAEIQRGIYKTQRQLCESQRQLQLQLRDVQEQLHIARSQLSQIQAESTVSQEHSVILRRQLESAQKALERKTKRSNNLAARCRKLQRKLKQHDSANRRYRNELKAIKSGKLWKLRLLWHRVKGVFLKEKGEANLEIEN